MDKSRLEAFSDGLFAVVITIMVLELSVPHGVTVGALATRLPIFLSYLLSFIYGGIFWVNHNYLLAATRRISPGVLWANLNFLFWMSLIPFFTAWVDENHAARIPVASYGIALFMVFASYRLLEIVLMRTNDADAPATRAMRRGRRAQTTLVLIAIGALMSFAHPFASMVVYVGVAAWWVLPKRALASVGTPQ